MMTLKKWLEWLKSRVRSFLGINSLATIGDIVLLRDHINANHRELMAMVMKLDTPEFVTTVHSNFTTQPLDWDMVQRLELQNLQRNPEKED